MNVPASALLTEASIPADFPLKPRDLTIHGLLAAYLASEHPSLQNYKAWTTTWPTLSAFEACMPILWPEKLRTRVDGSNTCSILPPAIGCGGWAHRSLMSFRNDMSPGLLRKQEAKFEKDIATVQRQFPKLSVDRYRYYWLVVNTRTFYYELPNLKEKRSNEDRLVMCPFVDFFNHADEGVSRAGQNFDSNC